MTIHTSKGLEFPYVFLCGFTEGVLPSAMSIKERRAKAIEEERTFNLCCNYKEPKKAILYD